MKLCTRMLAALVLLGSLSTAQAQTTRYWDITGTSPGATNGDGIADGTWDGTATNWNTDPTGGAAGAITAWTTSTDNAVFSAGNDVGSIGGLTDGAFVTITGTQTAASIVIEEGYVAFRGGQANTGAGTVTVNSGAILDIDSTARLNTNNGAGIPAGDVILAGGTLLQTNPGTAGTFLGTGTNGTSGDGGGLRAIMVDGIGFIGYNDGNGTPDNQVSIFSGVFKGREAGVDGTTTNGGRGTLVKIGPDQIGVGVSDQDFTAGAPRVHSQELFTFAKLEVREGAYRLRNQTQDGTVRETAFGAVPLAPLADAITLNGGGIGTNTSVTLHANRGVTIGPNGGYLDHGAGASITIPGSLTAAPGATLTVGSPTSTSASNVTFTLSNANNVNTFQGNINARRGVLQLNSSLNAANFSGTGLNATTTGTVNVAAGNTFTFGSGGTNTTYDGIVAGAGTFRKVGGGTTTFNGTNANTHSGDTRIEGGTLSITQAYLANAADVFLTAGSIFDLNFAGTDTIGALFIDNVQQAAGTWGGAGSGATNITNLITGTGILDVTDAPGANDADYNADGAIDAADFVAWRKSPGDFGGDPAGYDLWKQQFGQASPGAGGGGAVPEPSTVGLVLIGLAALAGRRRS